MGGLGRERSGLGYLGVRDSRCGGGSGERDLLCGDSDRDPAVWGLQGKGRAGWGFRGAETRGVGNPGTETFPVGAPGTETWGVGEGLGIETCGVGAPGSRTRRVRHSGDRPMV